MCVRVRVCAHMHVHPIQDILYKQPVPSTIAFDPRQSIKAPRVAFAQNNTALYTATSIKLSPGEM